MPSRRIVENLPSHPGKWCRRVPNRSGMSAYIAMIRDPEHDPPVPKGRNVRRHGDENYWRKLVRSRSPEQWRDAWIARLRDGRPRTFNALCIEECDTTADVLAGKKPEDGLWLAVEQGLVEYWSHAPVYFRLVQLNG